MFYCAKSGKVVFQQVLNVQLSAKSAQDPRQGHQASISAREERSQGKNRVTHWVSNPLIHTGTEEYINILAHYYRKKCASTCGFLEETWLQIFLRCMTQ